MEKHLCVTKLYEIFYELAALKQQYIKFIKKVFFLAVSQTQSHFYEIIMNYKSNLTG